MKSFVLALPLLAALVSARAVAPSSTDLDISGQDCAAKLAQCAERSVASDVGGFKCFLEQDVCKSYLKSRAAPPAPGIPDVAKLAEKIAEILKGIIGGKPGADIDAKAMRIASSAAAPNFDIGELVNLIINALDGKNGGINVGEIINLIIKAIGDLGGSIPKPGAPGMDIGHITNIVVSAQKPRARSAGGPDIDIGAIVKQITQLIGAGGQFDLGNIINEIIHLLNGKAGGIDVGQIVNEIIKLIMASQGGVARRQQGGIDIGELIRTIIELVTQGQNGGQIDIGKLIKTIIGLIPKGQGLARRQQGFDIAKLIQIIIELATQGQNGGQIDIGKLIQTIIGLIPKGQ